MVGEGTMNTTNNQAALHGRMLNARAGSHRPRVLEGKKAPSAVHDMTARIARGDHEAFDRFYSDYFPRLHRYLLVASGGKEETVKDTLQETMMRVIRHMKPFNEPDHLWNWLRRIARTALIDQLRKGKKRPSEVPLLFPEGLPVEGGKDPDHELKGHLLASLARLDEGERAMVEAKYFHNKSYEDLAKDGKTTPKAVESRLARIRKKLKNTILERLSHEKRR
jgi:RNA polymerase sigma-70 factor (ECF subfamily)